MTDENPNNGDIHKNPDEVKTEEKDGKKVYNDGRPYIVIAITDTEGSLGVSGSVYDKILAYGLLQMAHEAIQNMHNHNEKMIRNGKRPGIITALRNWRGRK